MQTFNPTQLTPSQIFCGYDIDDALRLVRYRDEGAQTTPGSYTDYFGIRTRLSNFFSDAPAHMDRIPGRFPFPNDGLHAELVEYLGSCKALEASGPELTIVEMGAGYAPWLVFSGVVARRLGAQKMLLVAIEAETARHQLIRNHLADNGFPLPGEEHASIETRIIHGAISDRRGTVTFGSRDVHDWGGAVQEEAGRDYRGGTVSTEEVPAMLMSDVLDGLPTVDLLHIDIQGWEAKAFRASLDSACAKVRYMVIGTHSRIIEGELIAMLRSRGWKLMHEKPCQFDHRLDLDDLAGATTVDGAQIWANAALGAQAEVPAALSAEDSIAAQKTRLALLMNAGGPTHYEAELESEVARLQEGRRELQERNRELQERVRALEASTSWRITAPLRRISAMMRHERPAGTVLRDS